jgi:hypothetical protein
VEGVLHRLRLRNHRCRRRLQCGPKSERKCKRFVPITTAHRDLQQV